MIQSHLTVTTITTVHSLHEIHDVEICTINVQNKIKVVRSGYKRDDSIQHFMYTKLLYCEQTSRLIMFTILVLVDCPYSET